MARRKLKYVRQRFPRFDLEKNGAEEVQVGEDDRTRQASNEVVLYWLHPRKQVRSSL